MEWMRFIRLRARLGVVHEDDDAAMRGPATIAQRGEPRQGSPPARDGAPAPDGARAKRAERAPGD